jgi:3-oxoacyl-[acyl-carrier protein] reductase|tara:strand:- start:2453 stop:3121 length:669 start_codon:yes stop_codon:yes gene_type:complete
MKQNIFIVGIGGSVGKAIYDFYKNNDNFSVFGSSTKKDNLEGNTFYLDFCNNKTIDKLPNIKIDHLIIASGYEPKYNIEETTNIHLEKMFKIHILGPMMLIQKMLNMLSTESSITLLSSPAAWQGSYDPAYASVKGATNSLIRTLSKDLAPNTRVNALSPSLIKSSTVFNSMTEDFKDKHISNTLNKRLITLDECVEGIDFILKSKHYTGQILHLNGGMIYG